MKSSYWIFSLAGAAFTEAISFAFLVANNLSIWAWIVASSIFSNNNPASPNSCPAGITPSPILPQSITSIFMNSRNFWEENGMNGSINVERLAEICKQIFRIVFTRPSSVLITFQGSVSAKYLLPKRARFIASFNASRKWKVSRLFSTRSTICGISARTSLS